MRDGLRNSWAAATRPPHAYHRPTFRDGPSSKAPPSSRASYRAPHRRMRRGAASSSPIAASSSAGCPTRWRAPAVISKPTASMSSLSIHAAAALPLVQRAGGRLLMNGMDLEDAKNHLGGAFEFMGVAVRTKEFEQRRPEMVTLAKALGDALKALRQMSGAEIVAAFPKEMTTGLDLKDFADIIARHRASLYPDDATIDLEAAKRVEQSLLAGGMLKAGASMTGLHDLSIAGGK